MALAFCISEVKFSNYKKLQLRRLLASLKGFMG